MPSRTVVTIDQGRTRHDHYRALRIGGPPPYRRQEDYIDRAHELLDQAVDAALQGAGRAAISASGGLDSSVIAATAARLGHGDRVTAYTLLPPADFEVDLPPGKYLDERRKMEALARMHPALDVRFLTPERSHPLEVDCTRRSFARAVLADRLPQEILRERGTGMQAGAWFCRLDMRRDEIAVEIERLEGSRLARRVLDLPHLKRLMSEWTKDERAAELRKWDFHLALDRGLHVGRFIRWVEGGNG